MPDALTQLLAQFDPALLAKVARLLEEEEAYIQSVQSYCLSHGYVLTPRGEDEMRRFHRSARTGTPEFRLLCPDYTTPR